MKKLHFLTTTLLSITTIVLVSACSPARQLIEIEGTVKNYPERSSTFQNFYIVEFQEPNIPTRMGTLWPIKKVRINDDGSFKTSVLACGDLSIITGGYRRIIGKDYNRITELEYHIVEKGYLSDPSYNERLEKRLNEYKLILEEHFNPGKVPCYPWKG